LYQSPIALDEAAMSEVGVVIVTLNALPHLARCLESLRGYDTVVVDHGSTDGTPECVATQFPSVKLIRQDNRGLAAGWNRGMQELGSPRYFFILNADAWALEGALSTLVTFANDHPDVAIVGPQLLNPDGSLQRSIRGFPTTWRLATQYWLLRKLAPNLPVFAAVSGAGMDYTKTCEVEWITGAAMLVRNGAVEEVGALDESFFLFSEEVDWCYRFAQAGWKIFYHPDAQVMHVGEASHGGRWTRELARSNLLYMLKHHGLGSAQRARWIMAIGLAAQAPIRRGWKRRAYWETARWLSSGSVVDLLKRREVPAQASPESLTQR
jgi:N-acetylglucosaminyl-diphospho-decaprenol L-rhamnosyltransferase